MIFVKLLFLTCSIAFLNPVEGQTMGRRPHSIEHIFCNLMFAEELDHAKTIDRRALSQAYRVGQNVSQCLTNCRIVSRGNVKTFDPLVSPDYVQCAPGPQYCYKGNCTTDKELALILKRNRSSKP